jgi:hypothetical protein
MTTPQIKIVNAETGKEIIRDMNAAELAQLEIDKAAAISQAEAIANKLSAREAVLHKLGLTADEASALLG